MSGIEFEPSDLRKLIGTLRGGNVELMGFDYNLSPTVAKLYLTTLSRCAANRERREAWVCVTVMIAAARANQSIANSVYDLLRAILAAQATYDDEAQLLYSSPPRLHFSFTRSLFFRASSLATTQPITGKRSASTAALPSCASLSSAPPSDPTGQD
jgi:hypothetical protein